MTIIDRRFTPSAVSWALLAQLGALAVGANVAIAEPMKFEVAASDASNALSTFSTQAGLQILFEHRAVEGRRTQAVVGEYEPSAALELLLKQSGLTFEFVNDKTVAIREPARERAQNVTTSPAVFQKTSAVSTSSSAVRVAQAADSDDQVSDVRGNDAKTAAADGAVRLEEVIVTGSHIRGAQNLSAPVIRIDREEIVQSGYATTQQFIQSLPQNVNSVSDAPLINGGAGMNLAYHGAAANLRGLGSDATLVLLNGRRLAGAGNGSFVDISLVPLTAIERIDVLSDGASAIYGSDAVGGVVNFVLRDDFEGAETRLRYGAVTEGNHSERQLGQMVGHAWDSGQALMSYEYFQGSALHATDRDFFVPVGTHSQIDLIPEHKRHGVLSVVRQRLSDRVGISSDLFFGKRNSFFEAFNPGPSESASAAIQYGGSVGIEVNAGRGWQARAVGLYDQSDSELDSLNHSTGTRGYFGNQSRLVGLDIAMDGPLITGPVGDIRVAFGAQTRHEEFVEEFAEMPTRIDRDIAAVYAEFLIPLVGSRNRRDGLERLELTLAARYEEYSDFGTTFNPKVGLAWAPLVGLNVRGTWGTSFKAPLLNQMNPGNRYAMLYEGLFVNAAGPTTALYLSGNGEDLGPEESTALSLGFDLTPAALPNLTVSATYFNIHYDNRISDPFAGYAIEGVLMDPAYSAMVTNAPSRSRLDDLLAGTPSANTYCLSYITWDYCDLATSLSDVSALVDGRQRNLAGVHMNGFDFNLGHRWHSGIGDWGARIGGMRLHESQRQLVPGVPPESDINEPYSPVDLRLRSSITFARDSFNLTAAVNYTDRYRDSEPRWTGVSIQRDTVSSWTTVDLSFQYEISRRYEGSAFPAIALQLSASNLFDKDPPYVANSEGLNYDGVNANPRGRFIAAQVTGRW